MRCSLYTSESDVHRGQILTHIPRAERVKEQSSDGFRLVHRVCSQTGLDEVFFSAGLQSHLLHFESEAKYLVYAKLG